MQRTLNNYSVELSDATETNRPARVHIYARSKKEVWKYGCEYEDFEGMNAPAMLSLNVEHDVNRTIGKAENFRVTEYGLECDAEIYPSLPTENSDGLRIINMLKLGIPLQASITFDWDNPTDAEVVDEGQTAEVNGMTIEGPATIYRRWNLRSLAICIHGADNATGVEAISLNKDLEECQMKKRAEEAVEKPEEKQVEQLEDVTVETPDTAPEPDRLAAVEAAIEELRAAIAELQAKAEAEPEPVQIEESEETDKPEPEQEDTEDKKELSAKIDALESTIKNLSDNLVKTLSAANAERQPVGFVAPENDNPVNGSLRFSSLGVVPSNK